MSIRPATSADHAGIHRVISAAFEHGASVETAIVEGVRAEGAALLELVAEHEGLVVGHVLFSRMTCAPQKHVAGLGPVAVHPDHQRLGLGGALCLEGLEGCRRLGVEAVVVLGHPAYYPRFGFSAAAAATIRSRYSGSPAFMAKELVPGALAAETCIDYPSAFA